MSNVYRLPVPFAAALEEFLGYLEVLDKTGPVSPEADASDPDEVA